MTSVYAAKLGLITQKIDVNAQKIDYLALMTYEIAIADFSLQDKLGKNSFFEETFLLADTSIKIVFRMPFLTLSDADVCFAEKKLVWRSYTTVEALPITQMFNLLVK